MTRRASGFKRPFRKGLRSCAAGVHAIVGPGLCNVELPDLLFDAGRQVVLGNIEIIVHLETQPETRRISEVPCESQRRVGRDTSPPVDDLVDSTWGDAEIITKFVLTDA